MDTVTVKLSKPIKKGDQTVTELTFREATIGDIMLADVLKGDIAKTMAPLAAMSGLTLPEFKEVSARDLSSILVATKSLMGNDTITTRESSSD
jgi:phage FluMu protein gp41